MCNLVCASQTSTKLLNLLQTESSSAHRCWLFFPAPRKAMPRLRKSTGGKWAVLARCVGWGLVASHCPIWISRGKLWFRSDWAVSVCVTAQAEKGRGLVLVGPTGLPEGTSVFPPGQNCCSHSEDEEVTSSPKLQCKLIKSETLTFFLTLYQVNS